MPLSDYNRYALSFDYLVECGEVDKETAKQIIALGYYGVPMTDELFDQFNAGEPYKVPEFALRCTACDGDDITEYNSKEALIARAREQCDGEYYDSPTGFHSDFARWTVIGATLKEAGVIKNDIWCHVLTDIELLSVGQNDDDWKLRGLLANVYSGGKLYRDDGELQDNSVEPFIDYLRDPVDVIIAKISKRGQDLIGP